MYNIDEFHFSRCKFLCDYCKRLFQEITLTTFTMLNYMSDIYVQRLEVKYNSLSFRLY